MLFLLMAFFPFTGVQAGGSWITPAQANTPTPATPAEAIAIPGITTEIIIGAIVIVVLILVGTALRMHKR
jgi:hypothetical protein